MAQLVNFEEDASRLKLGPDFNDAQCLLIAEVHFLLDTSKQAHENDETERPLHEVFVKSYNYATTFDCYKSKIALREARKAMEQRNLEEFEIASLGNLCPESAEEAKALIPTLHNKLTDEELELLLSDLKNYIR
jgi:DNA-directed RNA polymerase II subunit RPB4